jgi:phosphoribosylaminoimidazole-succinocarboxamide synthase
MKVVVKTDLHLPGQTAKYTGKVRDVYTLEGGYIVMVATDRISAFDVVLPEGIPYKGQVLNQIASYFLDLTSGTVPNWKIAEVDPMVTIGHLCEPYKVEMVVRGYLAGHAWREYRDGKRTLCGVPLPEGLRENEKLPRPIITPTTKESEGHDRDISREEIIAEGIVPEDEYLQLEKYALALFEEGTRIAAQRGLILVDTKYEFGRKDGRILLMDEIHTPDSSRYFYADGYAGRLERGEHQRQLSKEFVREWLMANGFQGQDGQKVPEMTPEVVAGITDRYIELFEQITGKTFTRDEDPDPERRISENIQRFLKTIR